MSSYSTTTGEGRGIVHCTFSVDSDGDVQDLEIHAENQEITAYLSLEQIEQIECECFDSYLREAKEHNDDMRIERFLSRMEA